METPNSKDVLYTTPRNISNEFLNMPPLDFLEFLDNLTGENSIIISIDWTDIPTARRLKAFLEYPEGPERIAEIRATKEQYQQEPNVFASGVKWIPV